MAEKILYPALSEDAWVTSPEKTADYLLSCFIVSDYSQTYIYTGQVSSLPWILQNTQGNIGQACSDIQITLQTYFSRFFSNVVVEVEEVVNPENEAKQQISMYVKFTDNNGKEHVLGKLLRLSNTIVVSVIALNNG
jgi:hypothetical protein